MSVKNRVELLSQTMDNLLDKNEHAWLNNARQQIKQFKGDLEGAANNLCLYTGQTKRKLGTKLLSGEIPSGFNQDSYGQCDKIYLDHWTVSDAARVLLFSETVLSGLFSTDTLFQVYYRYSDGGERESLLKGLPFIQLSSESTEFIIDVARTNSLSLFTALTYKNPWLVVNLPVAAFNQIVLKSLFLGININTLEGLRAARNSDLGRMTADYVQERIDADRDIPDSIWLTVDVCRLTDVAILHWVSALTSNPAQLKTQLALLACRWQPNLPEKVEHAIKAI